MKTQNIRFAAVLMSVVILSASFLSCSSTTMISTIPEGAKVYLNDEFRGVTPFKHSDSAISGTNTSMVLKREGYNPSHTYELYPIEP